MPHPYLDDPITRHMRRDVSPLRAGQTVGEALAHVRAHPPSGRIVYFYVTDADDRLVGVVPTRRMLLSAESAAVESIMIRQVVTIPDSATVLDACEHFIMRRLLAFPVVDTDKRFLGVVDIELYTQEMLDVASRESHDDAFQLIGFHFSEARRGSPLHAFAVRFPWLTCNIVGGILAALVTGVFQGTLDRHIVLALFIPAVLSLSESVGIQSVSLALDSLHTSREPGRAASAARRELVTAGLLGLACAFALAFVAWIWKRQFAIALTLFTSLTVAITCAGLIGFLLPYVMRGLRQDPRVAAGPIALVAADLATLLIYYNLAIRFMP